MSAAIVKVIDIDESRQRDEERRKRPDVQHYKPGAFNSRRQDPEDWREAARDEEVEASAKQEAKSAFPKGGSGRRGGQGKRWLKAKTPTEERELESGDKKNKKPEIEHYVPKKFQDKSEVAAAGRPLDEELKGQLFETGPRDGNNGPGTSKRNKKKKSRQKTNHDMQLQGGERSESSVVIENDEKCPALNDDICLDKEKDGGRRAEQQSGPKGNKERNWRNHSKEERLVSNITTGTSKQESSRKASYPSVETLPFAQSSSRAHTAENKKEEWTGQEGGSRRQNHKSETGKESFTPRDNSGRAAGKELFRSDNQQHKLVDQAPSGKSIKYSKSEFWDKKEDGSGRAYSLHGKIDRVSDSAKNGVDRRSMEGSGASRTWSTRGDRRRGDRARWSCHSSPSRSSRDSSPNMRSSMRSAAGQKSHNKDFYQPSPQFSRVFRRPRTPPSQRSTVSRTPSPSMGKQEPGGTKSSFRLAQVADSGRGDSRILRVANEDGGPRNSFRENRERTSVRDSRDLDGWSRGERRRYEEGLWDPQGKPPSGRVKSAPVAKASLPPRFQRRVGEEPSRRLDSETSIISDWSLEVEEEEERRSIESASPFPSEGYKPHQQQPPFFPGPGIPSGPGIIRLNAIDSAPTPHPAWRSPGPETWRQQPGTYHTLPASIHLPGHRQLYDPNSTVRLGGLSDRQTSPEYPGHPFPNARIPMATSRFAPPSHLLPSNVAPGPGYRPPFPQARLFTPQPRPRFILPPPAPDWYNFTNESLYSNRKFDVGCIITIVRGDNLLSHFVQGGLALLSSRWDKEVRETRHQIMASARHLLEKDIFFLAEHEVDLHIWKIVYYQLIEMLKSAYLDTENTDPETRQLLKSQLLLLFEEGVDYYTQLLTDLGEVYHVDLDRFYDALEPRELGRYGRVALIAGQKYLLCLGDLARYKEQVGGTTNYGRARQYYQKANCLDMRNGRPFNMLAILAKISNRKFEAVYYHIRCLMSRNPIPASKEGLNLIFEEMKRRWEAGEKQKLDLKTEAERSSRLIRGSRLRREIWIRGEGARRLHRTTSASVTMGEPLDQGLTALSVADLNKKFINTFLHLHGMLFTQINTDDFQLAAQSLLDQFRVLIAKSPLPLSADRLVQIMALNMYSIEETKLRAVAAASNYRSVMQTRALELAGDLFSILVERCNLLVAANGTAEILVAESLQQEELTPLLAAVKVWCDWLIGNNDTWYPVVSAEPFSQLAQLATRLEELKSDVSQILGSCISDEAWRAQPQNKRDEFLLIKLAEDTLLCDFEPWFRGLDWATYRQFCPRDGGIPSSTAENAKRIDQIRMCVEVLEGLELPVLKWSVLDQSHVCLVSDRDETTQESVARDIAEAKLTALIARDEDILEENYSDDEDDERKKSSSGDGLQQSGVSATDDAAAPSEEMARLLLRREELVRQEEARQAQRELLAQHVSTTLEVRPRILVPDTNAFVDHLEAIKKIALSGEFQLRIPVIVMGELEGLSKMKDYEGRTAEHAASVREASRTALTWIRDKHPNVKCVTTKGSILASMGVTCEEELEMGMKNDDKILYCCLALDSSPPPLTESGMKTVTRNAVLLTDDRNLKLKAHIQDCAVSRMKDFMSWIALP